MAPAAIVGRLLRGRATVVRTLVISIASGRRPLLPSSPLAAAAGPLGSSVSALSRPQSFTFSSATPVEGDARWGDTGAREGDFLERDDGWGHRAPPPESPMGGRRYPQMRPGDWVCPRADRRSFVQHSSFGRMDWVCPKCDYVNFGRNSTCLRCEDRRPSIQLKDGEWECPLCKFLNFGRNSYCLKCNHSRPDDATTKEDHISSTSGIASEKSSAQSSEESTEFKDDDLFGGEGNLLSDDLRKDEDSNKY